MKASRIDWAHARASGLPSWGELEADVAAPTGASAVPSEHGDEHERIQTVSNAAREQQAVQQNRVEL